MTMALTTNNNDNDINNQQQQQMLLKGLHFMTINWQHWKHNAVKHNPGAWYEHSAKNRMNALSFDDDYDDDFIFNSWLERSMDVCSFQWYAGYSKWDGYL